MLLGEGRLALLITIEVGETTCSLVPLKSNNLLPSPNFCRLIKESRIKAKFSHYLKR